MFKKFLLGLFSLVLIFPSLASSNEEEAPVSPFRYIQELHAQSPIDFIKLATEAASIRAEYSKVSLKLLRSDKLTKEQKIDYVRDVYQYFDTLVISYKIKKELKSEYIRKYNTLAKPHGFECLAEDGSAEDLQLGLISVEVSRNITFWTFLANSLKSYGQSPEPQSLEFTNALLAEIYLGNYYALGDLLSMQQNKMESVLVRDEVHYIRCLMETFMLHAKIVRGFQDQELPLHEVIYYTLAFSEKAYGVEALGQSFCLYFIEKPLIYKTGMYDDSMVGVDKLTKCAEVLKGTPYLASSDRLERAESALMAKGYFSGLAVSYFVDDLKRFPQLELSDPEMRERALQFCLAPNQLDFRKFTESIRKKLNQARADSFTVQLVQPKTQPKKKAAKANRAPPKINRFVEIVPEPVPVQKQEDLPKATKVKLPSKKEKREQKRQQKDAERDAAIQERYKVAEVRQAAHAQMLDGVEVAFGEGLCPSLEELDLYNCIWGPDSGRKDLSWTILSKRLESFGWKVFGNDGAFCILTPPTWFFSVILKADPELNLHFRPGKFMIHKPHPESQAPMPAYVLGYLHEGLGNNLGLSPVVLTAMMKAHETASKALKAKEEL